MFHIGIKVYMIHYLYALRQFIAIIKSFHKLRNDKPPADVTLVTEDDIQVKAHKIIISSSGIKNILHVLTVYDSQD